MVYHSSVHARYVNRPCAHQ
ncbi:unnamed protein product [Auanema sp. JU1783]|nr:unnamed protein product [Auanema sp. JU1783]